MPRKFKSFADAAAATPALHVGVTNIGTPPIAANDNKPSRPRKAPEYRHRGTLPVLRWLYDNHPDLAPVMADAVQSLAVSDWQPDAVDNDLELRPTVGELMRAATDPDNGTHLPATVETDSDGNQYVALGPLKFVRGALVEYGRTKKGRKLVPRDRIVSRAQEPTTVRDPRRYVFRTFPTTRSPLHATPSQRPISSAPALLPMYDPVAGVEKARAELRKHGIEGSVAFENLPFPARLCEPAIAKGADFLGGVVQTNGTSSSGAKMWEAPEDPRGEIWQIVDAIASGATLKEIGEMLGLVGARIDRMAKAAIVNAGKALVVANDNIRNKVAA